eukprot:2765918-Amphidinium_carterae.1
MQAACVHCACVACRLLLRARGCLILQRSWGLEERQIASKSMVKARSHSLAEQGENSSITKLERKHRDELRRCIAI